MNYSLQCIILTRWFLSDLLTGVNSYFWRSYPTPYFIIHVWIFILSYEHFLYIIKAQDSIWTFHIPNFGDEVGGWGEKTTQQFSSPGSIKRASAINYHFPLPISHHPLLKKWLTFFFPHILVKIHAHTNTHMCSQAEITSAKAQSGENVYDWVIHPQKQGFIMETLTDH